MTDNQKWLSKRYLVYQCLKHGWFVGAVWLYFYRIFITDYQVGILDGMAFAIGLVAEIPSGALADKFGRGTISKLGQTLVGGGLLVQAFGSGFIPFFVGQAILMIGASFVSGADEALFFQQLNFKRASLEWRKLVTRGTQVALMGSLIATILGGALHNINPRIPWFLNGLIFLVSVLVIWPIKDTREKSSKRQFVAEVKDYLHNIKAGFLQFKLPKLWLYVPIIFTVQGLFYAAGWGLLRLVLLDRFHFSPFWGSVVVASSALITFGILAFMHKNAEKISEKKVLVLISLGTIASLLLALADIGIWGYAVILALYAGEHTLYPFMSEILNNHAPERQRATVLSVAQFLRVLPYVGLAPIIGYLNTQDSLEYFLITWSALIAVAIVLYLRNKRRDEKIEVPPALAVGESV